VEDFLQGVGGMTNDEARMTKEARNPNDETVDLEIRVSIFARH
jgi:hypothetical protein